ncbi:MAG: dUTP diphosphatase [Bacteroidetes bacterium]|nr:dUTP diphosphatase [Bacteroidota bacterium]
MSNKPVLKSKKLHEDAILPTRANLTDAGYDLYALESTTIYQNTHQLVKTGISLEIPEGYVGLIWPRSGLSYKYGLDVFAGVIDSGYRGDIGVILYNSHSSVYNIKAGDRIAQILFQRVESFDLVEVKNLDNTQRGQGGFGSSGS